MPTKNRMVRPGVYQRPSGKFMAKVCVGGAEKCGKCRATLEAAIADAEELKRQQRAAKNARVDARDTTRAAVRAAHADELAANTATYGGVQDTDGLSREVLALAMRGSSHLGVANNAEYAKVDASVYDATEWLVYDPNTDYELHPTVLTLSIQLKATRALQPQKSGNLRAQFKHVGHYGDMPGLWVVMMYIPEGIVSPVKVSDLDRIKVWFARGVDLKGHVQKKYTLSSNATTKPIAASQLHSVVEGWFADQEAASALVPYASRSRVFEAGPKSRHAKGQAAIDAFERQVLRPMGARLLAPEDGREGGACDVRIRFKDGRVRTAQVKRVRLADGRNAGFRANLYRHCGSIRDANNKTVWLYRPYRVGESELYVFVLLDAKNHVAEYWCATEPELVGTDATDAYLADANGKGGRQGIYVHPFSEDKARLGDTTPNKEDQDAGPQRTRQWIQWLGPIVDPKTARKLADKIVRKRFVANMDAWITHHKIRDVLNEESESDDDECSNATCKRRRLA
jgi:hypothetical protein